MTKDEKSLLLYFEICLVDCRGQVRSAKMNMADFRIAKDLSERGLIKFGRISFKEIKMVGPDPVTHWIKFTDRAWGIVHKLRRQRAERHVPTIVN